MQEVCEFLKKCETYYLATVEDGKPRVRPFGTVNIFEGKLNIHTGKVKAVSQQIANNPNIEICAYDGTSWMRIRAVAVEDDSLAAKQSMLDAYPNLQGLYQANDGNTQVFYFKDAVATVSSFTQPPRIIRF